mgnify:CR=1 FL=1
MEWETTNAKAMPEITAVVCDNSYTPPLGNRSLVYLAGKRVFDFCAALLALLLLSPVLLGVVAAIMIDDPHAGPIYVSKRVGKNLKIFHMFKFRSMYKDADQRINDLLSQNEMSGPIFKIKNDPRITRIGRIIRSTSIDELPQLLNVIAGKMSFVGPRPTVPYEVEQYTQEQKQRFVVTPGLTCFYQVARDRYDFDFETCFELDMKYIQEQSFLLDMMLILKTVRIVLGGLSH